MTEITGAHVMLGLVIVMAVIMVPSLIYLQWFADDEPTDDN